MLLQQRTSLSLPFTVKGFDFRCDCLACTLEMARIRLLCSLAWREGERVPSSSLTHTLSRSLWFDSNATSLSFPRDGNMDITLCAKSASDRKMEGKQPYLLFWWTIELGKHTFATYPGVVAACMCALHNETRLGCAIAPRKEETPPDFHRIFFFFVFDPLVGVWGRGTLGLLFVCCLSCAEQQWRQHWQPCVYTLPRALVSPGDNDYRSGEATPSVCLRLCMCVCVCVCVCVWRNHSVPTTSSLPPIPRLSYHHDEYGWRFVSAEASTAFTASIPRQRRALINSAQHWR